jgi:hypothetical protein
MPLAQIAEPSPSGEIENILEIPKKEGNFRL